MDPEPPDPTDDPSYQAWLNDLAQRCRCTHNSPCDGLMAGGLCDEIIDYDDEYDGVDFGDDDLPDPDDL